MATSLAVVTALTLAVGARLPESLTTLERVAEEIDDAAVAHDWGRIETLEAKGDRALHALRTDDSAARDRAKDALADARTATRQRDALRTRFDANRLAGAVVDLYEPLHPTVPTSVMRLDVLLRTVDLAALDCQPGEARRALDQVQTIWKNLAVKSPVAGSNAQVSFAAELEAVERASKANDFSALHESAVSALEGVDSLEAQFKSRASTR